MKHKKHCMVVHAYYPLGESRVQREAEALIDNGYSVDVICLRRSGEEKQCDVNGVKVYRLPVSRFNRKGGAGQLMEYLLFLIFAAFRLSVLHLRSPYDVVQIHSLPDFLIFAALIPRISGAKIILDIHDLMPEFYACRFHKPMTSLPVQCMKIEEKVSCAFADHVITVTEIWRQVLVARGVVPEKSSVVMNLADDRLFHLQKIKRIRRPRPDGFHLFYHGTLTYRYGVDLILYALADLRGKYDDIFLTVHGQGEFIDTLKKLASELDLEGCINFSTNELPIEELPELIAGADLGIVPYRRDVFTDGILPTKLMEYAALGVPAVTVSTPAISEYFDSNMVEFFQADKADDLAGVIEKIYRSPDRRQELASNIQSFSRDYNWGSAKEEYVALIDRLAGC